MNLPFVRTVNAHGLVTIPAQLRHQLGWKPGTRLVIGVEGSCFVMQSAKDWKKEQKQLKQNKPTKTTVAKKKSRKAKKKS